MSNKSDDNMLTLIGLGLLILGGIFYYIVLQVKAFFGIDGSTASEVILKGIGWIICLGILLFWSRRLFETSLVAIPTSLIWLQPVFEFYAIHTRPNVPFAFTLNGQILMFVLLSLTCFAIWYFKTHVWKEIWA
ncbi:hypothetical protein ACT4ZU_03870 [Acinetobacter baumannii]|nr:hypothetical protein [Acinetobacter baumannii]